MDLLGGLKNLALDRWYKALVVIGSVLCLASLVTELKVVTNTQGLLLGGGLVFIGFGEWNNQGTQIFIENGFVFKDGCWKPTIIGILFDGIGIYLLYRFILSLCN